MKYGDKDKAQFYNLLFSGFMVAGLVNMNYAIQADKETMFTNVHKFTPVTENLHFKM